MKRACIENPGEFEAAALLRSAPAEDGSMPQSIPGTVPPPHALPPGCVFANRCLHRIDACDAGRPALERVDGRATRCIRWREFAAAREREPA